MDENEELVRVVVWLSREADANLSFCAAYYGLPKMHLSGHFIADGAQAMHEAAQKEIAEARAATGVAKEQSSLFDALTDVGVSPSQG